MSENPPKTYPGRNLLSKQFARFRNALRILRSIVAQTAVHRKKFEYCLEVLQSFMDEVVPSITDRECTDEDMEVNNEIMATLLYLRGIFTQYILQTWMEPTITNPAHLIVIQLQTQFRDLHQLFSHYNEPISKVFDIAENVWIQLHLQDLTAILASFKQYKQSESKDSKLNGVITERMNEIQNYISEHQKNFIIKMFTSPIPEPYKKWIVNYDDFELIERIGSGLSAEVHKALDKRTKKFVAIKQFKEKSLFGSHLQFYQREIAVLSLLEEKDTPFFLKIVGATDKCPICIMTEYMPNGGLNRKLRRNTPLSPLFKTITAYDIARGMAILHSLNIIHRDLKSLNILLDQNDRIKICDFGFSRSISDAGYKTLPLGTTHWMAPEILAGLGFYSFKVDVYAYAMVLVELVNQTKPFIGYKIEEVREGVLKKDLRPILPFDLNPELRNLITQCWDKNPDKRPTFAEIVKRFESMHVFFDGTDMVEFAKHIKELNKTTPVDDKMLKINMLKTGAMSLREIIDDISENGIPEDEIEGFWSAVPNLIERYNDRVKLSTFISFFFGTNKFSESVALLRTFPRNSIPMRIIEKLISLFPTSNEETNTGIIVLCCRNEGAPLAFLKAKSEKDIILTLEVMASQQDISINIKDKIIEKIVSEFELSESENIKISAMRCALSIKVPEIIPLQKIVNSENELLKKTARACLMGIGLKDIKIDTEILDSLLNVKSSEKEAQAALIGACVNKENAEYIIEKIYHEIENEIVMNEFLMKVFMQSTKHKELHSMIKSMIERAKWDEVGQYEKEVNLLKNFVQ
ncbi:TKL family protein kinase [Tritrichomonas foetus]|uniref:TKL family protein kinase n=1 Tax=Tritrichomonas foetus TaxID=1144522 RepID=A0A1J4JCY9_9EUKA|nr:TKL family protein kinase [Tritrichomonas foetus]|eukprot:OHS96553.1 TKL family protein kinase [Tritrichomonas foetus]